MSTEIPAATPVLELKDAKVSYGAIQAVKGIDLRVGTGELVCLIGANGAGQTTTLNAIAGVLPLASGEIRYLGEPVHHLPAHKRLRRGIALVPEGRGIFTRLTVEENLRMGAYTRPDKQKAGRIDTYLGRGRSCSRNYRNYRPLREGCRSRAAFRASKRLIDSRAYESCGHRA